MTCSANDNTLQPNQANAPTVPTDISHVFVFPDACTLSRVWLHGKAATIGTVNGKGTAFPIDLYVNQARVETLVTIPAGETDVDLHTSPGVAIPAGAEVQFVIPQPGSSSGDLEFFLFAFAID